MTTNKKNCVRLFLIIVITATSLWIEPAFTRRDVLLWPVLSQPDNSSLDKWLKSRESEYALRNLRIREVCEKTEMPRQYVPKSRYFFVDPIHRIALCRNAKVGSTTWLHHFTSISGSFDDENLHFFAKSDRELRQNGMQEVVARKNSLLFKDAVNQRDMFTFSFVRHPFERLASAYRDKILLQRKDTWIQLSSDLRRRNLNQSLFEVFLEHILSHENPHWFPFNDRCRYCKIRYDMIGKMETFSEDVKYVFAKNNLMHLYKEQRRHTSNHIKDGKSISAQDLFKQVSNKSLLFEVYQKYQLDFELFNYSLYEYLR